MLIIVWLLRIWFGGEERWKGRRNRARVEGNRPGGGRTFRDRGEKEISGENGAPVFVIIRAV